MAIEQDIVTWLEQHSLNLHLQDASGRKAFLFTAGLGELQNTLNLEGATFVFCRNLVQHLRQHGTLSDGRDPLRAMLETAKAMLGSDKQQECDVLMARLHATSRAANTRFMKHRVRRNHVILGIAILIALLGIIAIGYHYSQTPPPDTAQQRVTPAKTPSASSRVLRNVTTLTPASQNSATTTGGTSPAIIGDHNTVNY